MNLFYLAKGQLKKVPSQSEQYGYVDNRIGLLKREQVILVEIVDESLRERVVLPVFFAIVPPDRLIHALEQVYVTGIGCIRKIHSYNKAACVCCVSTLNQQQCVCVCVCVSVYRQNNKQNNKQLFLKIYINIKTIKNYFLMLSCCRKCWWEFLNLISTQPYNKHV